MQKNLTMKHSINESIIININNIIYLEKRVIQNKNINSLLINISNKYFTTLFSILIWTWYYIIYMDIWRSISLANTQSTESIEILWENTFRQKLLPISLKIYKIICKMTCKCQYPIKFEGQTGHVHFFWSPEKEQRLSI